MKERATKFELLRIIAMILIVSGHLASEGGVLESTNGINHSLTLAFSSGARIAVNLFLMIGCWFMVDAKYSTKRIVKLYSEVWFYSVLITSIFLLIRVDNGISTKEIIQSFFPFVFRTIWFATIYIMLIILSPFINKVFEFGEKKIRNLVIILFGFVSGISTISGFTDTFLCALVWFVFVYIFIGYYKKFLSVKWEGKNKVIFLLIGLLLYAMAISVRILVYYTNESHILSLFGKVIDNWIVDYKAIPNFLCALLIFLFFTNIKIKHSRCINWVASSTFAVYIIHQVPAFRHVVWKEIYKSMTWNNSKMFIGYYFTTIISFFIVSIIIDKVRKRVLEVWWLNTKFIKKIVVLGDRAIIGEDNIIIENGKNEMRKNE